jgi:hypothetical protein
MDYQLNSPGTPFLYFVKLALSLDINSEERLTSVVKRLRRAEEQMKARPSGGWHGRD